MDQPTQNDHDYVVYHFEMGSVDGPYSNIAFSNDKASAANVIHNCGCSNSPGEATSQKEENFCQCTANKKEETLYDEVLGIDKRDGNQMQPGEVHSPRFALYDKCNKTSASRQDNNSSALESKGGGYVNQIDRQERLIKDTLRQEKSGKRKQEGSDPETTETVPAGTQRHTLSSPQCCGSSIRLIALLQVLIFSMAAASLALVILIINGTIVCSADTIRDAAKTEKLTDLSSSFQEMQAQISKLHDELDNTRKELKKLREKGDSGIEELRREVQEIKNLTEQRIAENNVTDTGSDSNDKVDKVHFELMLNSSQQRIMTMLSDMWRSANKTDKEHREETMYLRLKGNSTQDQIQKVSDSLIQLTVKVRKEEKRLNDSGTLQLKERHSNDVASLEMLINSSRQDMMNNLTQMWTSVNSTGKDRQEHTKALLLAVWTEVNNTKLDLQEKINNISKMASSFGSTGFNGSQGPAGPAGSVGPPGPKGAGDFSSCQYQTVSGTTTGGYDSDALIDEPSGSIIMAATCSTNYAQEYNLQSAVLSQKRRYICNCKGPSVKFKPLHGKPNTCYLHYWLCSKT